MAIKHLTNFSIQGYKKFSNLTISNIGKFNLIIGQNNIGKTTLLESLLFSENIDETLRGMQASLVFRNISFIDVDSTNIFKGLLNSNDSFKYKIDYGESETECVFQIKETASLQQSEIDILNLKNIGKIPLPYVGILKVNDNTEMDFIKNQKGYSPFVSYKTDFAKDLFDFYSTTIQISKSAKEQFIEDLRLLIPDIENIELGSIYGREMSLIITLKNKDTPVAINDFGGGTIKLIRYLLELFVCENKRIMIDEIDTGLHYTKLDSVLDKILATAEKRNVQLFATTHSKECVESFIKSLSNTGLQSHARIIRLSETKNGIKAYTMEFEEFENAILAESEIR